MLKNLVARFAKSFLQPAPRLGYQTRIYPTIGEMIVVHDSLDFGLLATEEQLNRMVKFWERDEAFDIPLIPMSFSSQGIGYCSSFDINPANGLPMMCDTLDVMGNPFGWSDTTIELTL